MTKDKDMTGVLFTVTEKKSDAHPDMTGKVTIDGKVWSLSVWKNTSKAGTEYLSVKVREFTEKKDGLFSE